MTRWKDNHAPVLPLLAGSPGLGARSSPCPSTWPGSPRSVSRRWTVWSRARASRPPGSEEQRKVLAEAAKPAAHAELVVVKAIGRLVEACAGTVK